MAGTELGQGALDRVAPQRSRLASALRDYQLATLNPSPGWARGVGAPLRQLQLAFEDHVEFTEGPGGLFESMLDDDTASVTSEIDHLRRDHIAVMVAVERAHDALARPPSDDDHLRELVASVARLVGQHRRRGAQLLYDVYSVDTSVGD